MDQWQGFGVRELLKQRGIYDPDKIVLQSIQAPELVKKSSLPPPAELAKLTGDDARGKLQSPR